MHVVDDGAAARMVSLAPGRRQAYAFLSSAFSEPPSAERLGAVGSEAFLASAAGVFSDAVLAPLRRFSAGRDREEQERQARSEYLSLFRVPGGRYVAPYESSFRDTREIAGRPVGGLLMGRSAVDVQKWYRLAALDISEEYKDLPDHIALELSYLSHLCGQEGAFSSAGQHGALKRAWEMQRDFLAAHVVSWVGALRDKIHAGTEHAYFRGVADMAVEFTGRDLATLEGLIGPSSRPAVPAYDRVDA